MTRIDDLVRAIADAHGNGTASQIYTIATDLGANGIFGDLPALQGHLDRCLDAGNFFGRDMIAVAIAGIAGVEALPILLTAAACDLGDDQDSLTAVIWDVMAADDAGARTILAELVQDLDPGVREAASWAVQFLGDSG